MMDCQHCGPRRTHGRECERDAIGEGSIQSGKAALSPYAGTRDTHRSADGTTRNGQFNALVRLETVDAAFGE
jgi:hypothetical protein